MNTSLLHSRDLVQVIRRRVGRGHSNDWRSRSARAGQITLLLLHDDGAERRGPVARLVVGAGERSVVAVHHVLPDARVVHRLGHVDVRVTLNSLRATVCIWSKKTVCPAYTTSTTIILREKTW